ncbi:MAG: hypothetical protein U0790_22460 [Isosphaeraceae bacterium]
MTEDRPVIALEAIRKEYTVGGEVVHVHRGIDLEIIVTHEPEVARRCGRVVRIRNGNVGSDIRLKPDHIRRGT